MPLLWKRFCGKFRPMNISGEHVRITRRLKRGLKKGLGSNSRAKKESRRKREGRVSVWGNGLFFVVLRLVVWCFALAPFTKGWVFCVLFSTVVTVSRAYRLGSRGGEEALVELYGANDGAIIGLSRRWMRSIAWWSFADAIVILGLWWWTGLVPLWALLLGIPLYVVGSCSGVRLLAFYVPKAILGTTASLGFFLAWILVMVGEKLQAGILTGSLEFFAYLSPSGWVLLWIRAAIEGPDLVLWLLTGLLLAVSVATLRFIKPAQECRLLEFVGRGELIAFRPLVEPDETGSDSKKVCPPGSSLDILSVTKEFESFRNCHPVDYPDEVAPRRSYFSRAAWTLVVVLVCAGLVRVGGDWLGGFRYIFFAASWLGMVLYWFPFVGVPTWLSFIYLSQHRIASACVLFAVSFRKLLFERIRRDGFSAGLAIPLIFVANAAGFWVAFPMGPAVASIIGFTLTLWIVLKLPLVWFHLAMWPLSNKPFRLRNLFRGLLVSAMVLVFLLELGFAGYFVVLACEEGINVSLGVCTVGFGLLNGLLALLGVYFAISTYEGLKSDVVKAPPTNIQ